MTVLRNFSLISYAISDVIGNAVIYSSESSPNCDCIEGLEDSSW